jgi:hypothetical protein
MSLKNNFDFPKMSEEEQREAFAKAFYGPKNHFVDMPDRFVLEDDITHQSDINDQINLLIEDILDNPELIDPDDLVNTLSGINAVHELRTNKLWQHFKIIYELDEYSDEAKKKACKSGSCAYNENIDPDTWMKYQR